MARLQSVFICQQCGARAPKWQGRCAECGAWNSYVEDVEERPSKSQLTKKNVSHREDVLAPLSLGEDVCSKESLRFSSGFKEVDRVLGGGFVKGSLLLFGGQPGIGKSTLLLQIVGWLSKSGFRVLYVSGEESRSQVAARARRLSIEQSENLFFQSTLSLEEALMAAEKIQPSIMVVDSIQTIASAEVESVAGTVSQVRTVSQKLLELAKQRGITILLVGQITKDGQIAGPKLVEHMVDAVFYFDLMATGAYRLLRAHKNRFGACHETAIFEMSGNGLREIANPSQRFLAERALEMPGSAVVAQMEGTQVLMSEIQCLTNKCFVGYPRRTSQGIDPNRVAVLMAVAEKILKVVSSDQDVYFKVAAGGHIEEPAADLPVIFSLVSALSTKPLPNDVLLIGEVGLGGEVRSVPSISLRIHEGLQMGMSRFVIPAWNLDEARALKNKAELIPVKNITEVKTRLF